MTTVWRRLTLSLALLALWIVGSEADISICCMTQDTDSSKTLLNLTVYWYEAAAYNYAYKISVKFPAAYTVPSAQPFRRPKGNVNCVQSSNNTFACSSTDITEFFAEFNMIAPSSYVALSANVQVLSSSMTWVPCDLSTSCAAVPFESPTAGTLDFGLFGRRPKWFAVVLAAAGGIIIALLAFAALGIRNQMSAQGSEAEIAKRHAMTHGTIATDKAIARAESIRRAPTIRQVQHDRTFGASGTLVGGLAGVADIRETRTHGTARTLVDNIVQSAHHNAEGVVPTPIGIQRERSMRSRAESPIIRQAAGVAGTTSNGSLPGSPVVSESRKQSSRRARKDGGEHPHFISMDPYRRATGEDDGTDSAVSPSRSRGPRSALAIDMPPITPTTPSITTLQRRLPIPESNNGNTSALNLADLQRLADQQDRHVKMMRDRAPSGTNVADVLPVHGKMRDRTYSSGDIKGKKKTDKSSDAEKGTAGRAKVAPKDA
ncbi:hypothetical protein HDU89_008662 [Geranomyces variabilis]|nr:hypothetical protein HDU89_008662 [Geranomyces variabilis]